MQDISRLTAKCRPNYYAFGGSFMRTSFAAALSAVGLAYLAGVAAGPASAAPVHQKPHSYTQGHGQLSGGNGEFGVVYSFQDHWNEEILSARYDAIPIDRYEGYDYPKAGQKLLVLAIAIKNPTPRSNFFNSESGHQIVAFDQFGNQYPLNAYEQQSAGEKGIANPILNPGQGLGQPALHDPIWVMGPVDGKARIQKIIINAGRLDHPTEKVLRYYMSTATAAEDGANGDPHNEIGPLPDGLRDPSDSTGATALNPANGGKPGAGTLCPSNGFVITLDAFGDAPSGFTYHNNPAPAGKKYVLATVTLKNGTLQGVPIEFAGSGGTNQLKDADGDTFNATGYVKKSNSDDAPGDNLDPGSSRTMRYLYTIPSNESATTFSLSCNTGLQWTWNVGS
jgi:hypothetical protein